ncbi:class I SAM-dependent methyltransferase [Patescibacteria group bacterium]|nr:class I SAM-dependent methyltransferase [Patescibacteria group bacterium]
MKQLYKKFLSSGFADLNLGSYEHMILMYRHNYSRLLPSDETAKILDIGCGMGQFLQFLAEDGYENISGVDISPEAVEFCREKGINKVKQIDDLVEFLNTSEVYDLIVLNDVIEHFPKEKGIVILQKIYEKLRIGGKIIIKTGNMSSLAGLRLRYDDFTHYDGFTEYSLTQVLKACNFKNIGIYPFVFPLNRLTRIIRFAVQTVIHLLWKAVYFFEFTAPPKIVDEIIFAVAKK